MITVSDFAKATPAAESVDAIENWLPDSDVSPNDAAWILAKEIREGSERIADALLAIAEAMRKKE